MPNQFSDSTDHTTSILLDEILIAPSKELLNDRFNPMNVAEAPCGGAYGAGCGGGCGGGKR